MIQAQKLLREHNESSHKTNMCHSKTVSHGGSKWGQFLEDLNAEISITMEHNPYYSLKNEALP